MIAFTDVIVEESLDLDLVLAQVAAFVEVDELLGCPALVIITIGVSSLLRDPVHARGRVRISLLPLVICLLAEAWVTMLSVLFDTPSVEVLPGA